MIPWISNSSFPFLNQDNISHFCSLLQDMDGINANTNESSTADDAIAAAFGFNNDLKKRKRKVDDEDDNNDYRSYFSHL